MVGNRFFASVGEMSHSNRVPLKIRNKKPGRLYLIEVKLFKNKGLRCLGQKSLPWG